MDAVTTYLGYGSYLSWDESKRIEFLTKELQVVQAGGRGGGVGGGRGLGRPHQAGNWEWAGE